MAIAGSEGEAGASENANALPVARQQETAAMTPVERLAAKADGKQWELVENQRGITYYKLFGPYLAGAKKIVVEDAYVRKPYQLRNLAEFLEMLLRCKKPDEDVAVHLVTGHNDPGFVEAQLNGLNELASAFSQLGVNLTYEFRDTLHDRSITADTGWEILPVVGLTSSRNSLTAIGLTRCCAISSSAALRNARSRISGSARSEVKMNVQCPACGTYVAETATMCPYCGFRGDDPSRPIYKQGEYRPVPIVPCEIVMDDDRRGEIWLSDEDSKNLFRHLTNWKWLSTMLPALAETLESMFGGTVHLEAKLPEHIMRMIEEDKLHFATDKNGEILAEVFDERNKIFKQVRLEKVVRNDTLLPAMQHLETQAALCLVMEKIDEVGRAVQQLGEEMQQDRLARVDAAFDMFQQACRIESSRERNEYVREAFERGHAREGFAGA